MLKITYFLCCVFLSTSVFAKGVFFEIKPGTAEDSKTQDWNSEKAPLEAEVGDTLIIFNDDSKPHQLHAEGGRPCDHGELIKAGGIWSCVLKNPFANDPSKKESLRDHINHGVEYGRFWIIVHPKK